MARWDGHKKLPGTAAQRYASKNPGHSRPHSQRLRLAALGAYSNGLLACASCGHSDVDVLTLDHILDDGAAWRNKHNVSGGANTYHLLQKLGYPSGFQVLCMNCNWKKEITRRISSRLVTRSGQTGDSCD